MVHEPIATTRWSRRSLDEHIAEVRALFEQTLERGVMECGA